MKINWSALASRDADGIWLYIAMDNPDAADRAIARFHQALTLAAEQPRIGRRSRSGQTREMIVAGTPYIIIYDVTKEAIEVRRVIHGARDWPKKR